MIATKISDLKIVSLSCEESYNILREHFFDFNEQKITSLSFFKATVLAYFLWAYCSVSWCKLNWQKRWYLVSYVFADCCQHTLRHKTKLSIKKTAVLETLFSFGSLTLDSGRCVIRLGHKSMHVAMCYKINAYCFSGGCASRTNTEIRRRWQFLVVWADRTLRTLFRIVLRFQTWARHCWSIPGGWLSASVYQDYTEITVQILLYICCIYIQYTLFKRNGVCSKNSVSFRAKYPLQQFSLQKRNCITKGLLNPEISFPLEPNSSLKSVPCIDGTLYIAKSFFQPSEICKLGQSELSVHLSHTSEGKMQQI